MQILYYAVYEDHTLGYVYDQDGQQMLGVLHESVLKGAPFRVPASEGPLYIDDPAKLRKATEKDFEEFGVSLPPDFRSLNV